MTAFITSWCGQPNYKKCLRCSHSRHCLSNAADMMFYSYLTFYYILLIVFLQQNFYFLSTLFTCSDILLRVNFGLRLAFYAIYFVSVESISAYCIFWQNFHLFYAAVNVYVKGLKQKLTLYFCTAFLYVSVDNDLHSAIAPLVEFLLVNDIFSECCLYSAIATDRAERP